jgi:valyl-tRNA synthetase
MPFVTEALWDALPHRESDPDLLIVARWPVPLGRDEALEAEVAQVVELVRGIRNARAEAKVEAAARLPVDVAVPLALDATFEALRPAVERLARARPLTRHLTLEALHEATHGRGLAVISGEVEAVVRHDAGSGVGLDARERARLEKELAENEAWLDAARARLLDEAFVSRAPAEVVDRARARELELADTVARLRSRLEA